MKALDFAIDDLYATGWTPSVGDPTTHDGRAYPSERTVREAFRERGLDLTITHLDRFGCHRAEWTPRPGGDEQPGSVVGASVEEAAVFALARLRRRVSALAV